LICPVIMSARSAAKEEGLTNMILEVDVMRKR